MTFTKHDAGKRRYSLLPWSAVNAVVDVLEHGAKKYTPDNWHKVDDPKRYFDAAQRHLVAWCEGERLDAESGLPHLAHAACCVLFLLALDKVANEDPALVEAVQALRERAGVRKEGE